MEQFDLSDLRGLVAEAVTDLFEKNLAMGVELAEPGFSPPFEGTRISVSACFIGNRTASLVLSAGETLTELLAAGLDSTDRDAMHEVCEHVVGKVRKYFSDSGLPCPVSAPFVTAGRDFRIKPVAMGEYDILSFKYLEHAFTVELGLSMSQTQELLRKPSVVPGKADIGSIDLSVLIKKSVDSMFGALFSIKAVQPVRESDCDFNGSPIVATVGIAGGTQGAISLYVSNDFARLMASEMLDIPFDEIRDEDEIINVVGQVAFVIGRNYRKELGNAGHSTDISNPFLTTGTDFAIDHSHLEINERFAFQYEGHTVLVEAGLKMAAGDEVFETGEPVAEEPESEIAETWDDFGDDFGDFGEDFGDGPEKDEPPAGRQTDSEEEADSASVRTGAMADFVYDIPLEVSVELGNAKKKIGELLDFSRGSVIVLSAHENEPVDVFVNGKLIARGEVVVDNGKYGVRITEIKSMTERLDGIK